MRPVGLSSLSSISANVVDKQLTLDVRRLERMQGSPFRIVPVPVLEAKSRRPVQDFLFGAVRYLPNPTDIDVVAVYIK